MTPLFSSPSGGTDMSELSDYDAPAVRKPPPEPPKTEGIQPMPEATKPVVGQSPRAIVFAETDMGRIATGLNVFIHDFLPKLSKEQLHKVVSALPAGTLEDTGQGYGANFSLADEIGLQIVAVQNLRQYVFPNGHLRESCNIREAKEVLTTCNVMIKTMIDNHDRIMSMERMRAVEAATVDTLVELDDDLKEQFLERLRARLEGLT
jgi:hypothetical protein